MAAYKELLEKILSLSLDEKAELVDQLMVSLEQPDKELDKLWIKEAEDRLDAHERGEIKAISLEEVLKKYK